MTDNERLDEIIKSAKMSVKAFSEFIEMKSPQPLYDILKGRNGISKDIGHKIHAKCVQYNLAWILTGIGDAINNSQNSSIDKRVFVGGDANDGGNVHNVFGDGNEVNNTLPTDTKGYEPFLTVIDRQSSMLAKSQEQIDKLLDLLMNK